MELSRFLHDNYPDIVIVIFSGFGEFEYAKKAIQYGVSEYMLKPVTAMELRNVIEKMKEKVDQQRKEKEKLERLTQTSVPERCRALWIISRHGRKVWKSLLHWESILRQHAIVWLFLIWICIRTAVSLLRRNARRVH